MTEEQLQNLVSEINKHIDDEHLDKAFHALRTNTHVFEGYKDFEDSYLWDYSNLLRSKQISYKRILKCFLSKCAYEYIEKNLPQAFQFASSLKIGYNNLGNKVNYKRSLQGATFEMICVEGGLIKLENKDGVARYASSPLTFNLPDFYLSDTLVTQELWNLIMQNRNYTFANYAKDIPISYVNKQDALLFCKILSEILGETYSLPTEAQWQYAALGGLYKQATYKYAGSYTPQEVAWTVIDGVRSAQPVKQKKPNPLGVYDMSGNLWEWCENSDPNEHSHKYILRGGAWNSFPYVCRVEKRLVVGNTQGNQYRGFRICRNL